VHPPALVVTIDTEEEGLWSGSFRAVGNTCLNITRLPRVQRIFTRLGVRATYLVDYPVATDARAGSILRELAGDGSELGAHLHPWCTPPLVDGGTRPIHSYANRIAPSLQSAKLATLIGAIETHLGRRPRSFRAGRWGFDHKTVPLLERAGITVDSSIRSLWWDPERGGPHHAGAPLGPYRLGHDDACRPGGSGVVEVPFPSVVLGRHGRLIERLARRAPAAPGLRRVLRQLGLRALTPEDESIAELRKAASAMLRRALPVLHIMFHSSSALPGATPYVRSERDLDAFAARLEALLEHVLGEGAVPLTLAEVPGYLGAA
jgi:hypothetical protein